MPAVHGQSRHQVGLASPYSFSIPGGPDMSTLVARSQARGMAGSRTQLFSAMPKQIPTTLSDDATKMKLGLV